MNKVLSYKHHSITLNIVLVFLVLALLRLLPFNFYASTLIGHDVIIDNKEGNAINFINYISVAFLFFTALIKLPTLKAHWFEIWPFCLLVLIYLVNLFTAPYVNLSWTIYQIAFLLIGAFIHLTISGQSNREYEHSLLFGRFKWFTVGSIAFMFLVFVSMYSQFSVSYIISEFNDSFVNSVNTYGLMKQYYGYVVGFLVLYSIFVLDNIWLKTLIILLAFFTAFGIRSFVLGMIGVLFFMNIKSPIRILAMLIIGVTIGYVLWEDLIVELLYDTRFYAYMNGWDIVQKFPFGVGLGGYPEYTELNNRNLFAAFFTIDAALNYVPNSPESDIVHVFGSLGLYLGIAHVLIQLRLIWNGFVRQAIMLPFEKCMFYFFIFMTAFGISEDTMFTVSYWIFFGITSGIIASLNKWSLNA